MLLNVSRSRILLLTFLALTFICFQKFACRIAIGQQWPKLTYARSIELDAELVADLPFDLSKFQNVKEAENREQGYFQIVALLSAGASTGSFEDAATGTNITFKTMPAKLRRRAKKINIARGKFDKFVRMHRKDLKQVCQDESQAKKLRKMVKSFDWVFEDLAELQKSRKACVLVNGFSSWSYARFKNSLDFVAKLVSVRYLLAPESEAALDELGIVLEMFADFKYGHVGCYESIVKEMLNGRQSPEHLGRLLGILKKYANALERTYPAIEEAKLDLLQRKSAYLRLRRIVFGFPGKTERLSQALSDVGVGSGWGLLNDDVMRFWLKSTRPAAERAFMEELFLKGQVNLVPSERRVAMQQWNEFFEARVGEMTVADFNRDLGVLKLRYEEIEKACAQPFPQSERSLEELRRLWNVTDHQWLSSPLLISQRPPQIPSHIDRLLRANAFLCIAAVKRWQMEHHNRPNSLLDAIKAIGLKEVPVDPWSGKPLLFTNDHNILVYSVGPDGIDQKGARLKKRKRVERTRGKLSLEEPKPREPRKGDISFEIIWQ